jgi:hypothetical protein
MLRFLPTILMAICFLPGCYIGHFFTGPAPDLFRWLFLSLPCAWLLAMLLGSLSLLFTRSRSERNRILGLTISAVVLFFPIRGVFRGLAEEITLRERVQRNYQSDEGITYMYGEMSGMGHAAGLTHWPTIIYSWFFLAVITALIWLPLALLFSRWTADFMPQRMSPFRRPRLPPND